MVPNLGSPINEFSISSLDQGFKNYNFDEYSVMFENFGLKWSMWIQSTKFYDQFEGQRVIKISQNGTDCV